MPNDQEKEAFGFEEQDEEGTDVEAHAFGEGMLDAPAAKEEPPDVEGHAFGSEAMEQLGD